MVWFERRKEPRNVIAMPARLRRLTHDLSGVVRDLSTAGCRVEVDGLTLNPGNRVLIRPHGFECLLGTVIWRNDSHAGVEFETALEESRVKEFCRLFPSSDISVRLDVAA